MSVNESGKRKVESGRRASGMQSVRRLLRSHPHAGVTLIELLVAITIISILAGLILGVGAVAAETARESATRTTILRIHTLLMDHYDTYRNRRVSLSDAAEGVINNASGRLRGQLTAEARLHALREILVTEIPDRWSDVLLGPVPNDLTAIADSATFREPLYLDRRTSLGTLFARELQRYARTAPSRADLLQNQSAECLFMVVMLATGDGEAPELFGDQVIGDTDGDGAREFLDGWGNPIRFLRWAPGTNSPTQLSVSALRLVAADNDPAAPNGVSDIQAITNAVIENRDPFDLFRVQQYTTTEAALLTNSGAGDDALGAFGYHLLPLVYSIGGDEESGIIDEENLPSPVDPDSPENGYIAWNRADQSLDLNSPSSNPSPDPFGYRFANPLNPYRALTASDTSINSDFPIGFQIGAPLQDADGEAATDNITNHLITARAQK